MKKLALVVAMATLSACGGAATDAEAPAEMAEAEAPATTAADGGPSFGMFKVTDASGAVNMEDIKADGTYTSTDADGVVSTGVWEQKSPNEFCSQPSDADAMKCYAEAINDDGVWTSTDPDDGEVSTIERVVAETEAATTEG